MKTIPFVKALTFLKGADDYWVYSYQAPIWIYLDDDEPRIACSDTQNVKGFSVTAMDVKKTEIDRGGLVKFTLVNGEKIEVQALELRQYENYYVG